MTSHRKRSPVEVIDICDDDDDDNNFLLASSAAATCATTTTAAMSGGDSTNKNDDSDRKPAARAAASSRRFRFSSLSPVQKRALSSSLQDVASTAKKKVKTEGTNNKKDDMEDDDAIEVVDVDATSMQGDDDEVEVVNHAAASCVVLCPPVAAAAGTMNNDNNNNSNDDDDLQVVGTTGTVRLPHLREDCTEKTFQSQNSPTASLVVTTSRNAVNRQCCDMCYCYVCDLPASECMQWTTLALHCNAERSNPFWKNQRQLFKSKSSSNNNAAAAAPAAAAAASAASVSATRLLALLRGEGGGGAPPPPPPPPPAERRRAVIKGTSANPLPPGYHFNKKCGESYGCAKCFCYVCNRTRGECTKWSIHRTALPTGPDASQWRIVRKKISRERRQVELHPRVPAGSAGPFEPDHDVAQHDTHLTKCMHCGYFNRFKHKNFEFLRHKYPGRPSTSMGSDGCDIHPLGVLDWCHACGRVASEQDFGKEQSAAPYTPAALDVFLGTKTIEFTVVARDPSQMSKYKDRYEEREGESEWEINEAQMQQELFRHRIGPHPTLDVLLASIPIVDEDSIPPDSDAKASGYAAQSWQQPSLLETEALLVDSKDLHILDGIKATSPAFCCRSSSSAAVRATNPPFLDGDITATWDAECSTGTLTVRVYVKEMHPKCAPVNIAEFFGAWFGVFPLPLHQICGLLHPKKQQAEVYNDTVSVSIPPFTVNKEQVKSSKILTKLLQDQDSALTAIRDTRPSTSLLPGAGMSAHAGGICTNETTFHGILARYACEMFPDVLDDHRCRLGGNASLRRWLEYKFLGRVSSHREMKTASATALIPDYKWDERCNSMVSPQQLDLAAAMFSNSVASVVNTGRSIASVVEHLVNLGHASAPFVDGLKCELLPFQLQTLQWALERERAPGGIQSYWWSKVPKVEQDNTTLYYNPILGRLSKDKPALFRGGFLNQQMGMGKTVICLAMILSNPAPALPASGSAASEISRVAATAPNSASTTPFWDTDLKVFYDDEDQEGGDDDDDEDDGEDADNDNDDEDKPRGGGRPKGRSKKHGSILSRGTLVVCNVSLVGQWIEEARSKLSNPGIVYSYHGSGRKRDAKTLSSNAVVVTTYETLASDATYHAKKGGPNYCPPCENIRWWRVVCDEAHILRNGSSKTSAVMNIAADHKWLVSGTPICTGIQDLSNQLKFLGIQDAGAMMKQFKENVCNNSNGGGRGRGRSRHSYIGTERPRIGSFTFLMRAIMMRHTQNMMYAGSENTTLMSLPPMTQHVVTVPFAAEDQEEYDTLEAGVQTWYQSFKKNNAKNIGRHYLRLSQKLLPLRIACTGGPVPIESECDEDDKDDDDDEKVSGDEDDDADEEKEEAEEKVDDDDNAHADEEDEAKSKKEKKKPKKPQAFSKHAFTSKLDKLIEELKKARDEDPTSKSLVFSQFNSTLKWLQQELPRHGFQFRTLSGDMTMTKRAAALRDFQNDPPTTIFILSMRAGAVGINLTQASRVFIMEPCLNPAIEAQAIGRVHRLGQQRPVKITRLVMENSIETRMREMLAKKYGTNNNDADAEDDNANASATTPVEDDDDDDDDEEEGEGGGESSSNKKNKKKPAPGTTTTVAAAAVSSAGVVNIGSLRTEKTAVLQSEFDLLFGVEDDHQHADEDDPQEEEDSNAGGGGGGAAVPDTMLSLMQNSASAAGAGGSMETESI